MTSSTTAAGSHLAALDEVIAAAGESAGAVDRYLTDLRPFLGRLAASGLADLGVPGAPGTLGQQAGVVGGLGRVCMASAFTLWAHRMATHYVALGTGERLSEWADELRSGARPGSTAMAGAFRDAAGLAELSVTFERRGGAIVLNGQISWASNLYPDAIVVTAVRHHCSGERLVVAVPVDTPGVDVRPTDDLLALGSTRSGAVELIDVPIADSQVISDDLVSFVKAVRSPFLVLQSAFCLGLAGASLDSIAEPTGVGAVFVAEVSEAEEQRRRLSTELDDLAGRAGTPDEPSPTAYWALRLGAGTLARQATQLELTLTGGRGYLSTSPTARRVREALFLPVQSPTEGHLRWELSRSA